MKFIECFERLNDNRLTFINTDRILEVCVVEGVGTQKGFDVILETQAGNYAYNIGTIKNSKNADDVMHQLIKDLGGLIERPDIV